MAVDTQTKRRSALAATLAFLVVAPLVDGTVAAVDREHIIGIYAGIAPGSPPTGLQTTALHIFSEDVVEPNHVSDSGNNVLFKGGIESMGGSFFGGGTNYTDIDSTGDLIQNGSAKATLGGGSGTNMVVEADGDTYWVGAGTGLPGGSFWGNEVGFVAAGGTGSFFEVADADITVGQTNLVTFQNNKELAVIKAGIYEVHWSMSVKATGANKHIVGGIGVDAGGVGALTIQDDGRTHAVSTGNAEFSLAGTAWLDLSASSEVGLMATNETDNTNVTIEHVNLVVRQVGGT